MTEKNRAEDTVTDADAPAEGSDAAGAAGEQPEQPEQAGPGEVVVEPAGAESMDELFLSPDDSESEVIEIGGDGADGEAGGAADGEELRKLREANEALEKERDDYKNRMLRVAADLENFRRRASREKEDLRKFGIDKVILELLPVVDNLERALEHAEKSAEVTTITDGVRMVYRQFVGALEKHGVKGFDSRGEAFDPQRHEAIQQVETDAHDTGTVMEQYQKGYFLHERLIRPALVAVAKRVESAASEQGGGDAEAQAEAPTQDDAPAPSEADSTDSNGSADANASPDSADDASEETPAG